MIKQNNPDIRPADRPVYSSIKSGLLVPANGDSADFSGPCAAYAVPSMMKRKFIGETAGKIVSLADIYRLPSA